MTCCRNSVFLICGLLLLALLGGCAYKSVTIEIHQDTSQEAGGNATGGSSTGSTSDITRAAAEKMGPVLQPLDLKQVRKLLEAMPDSIKQSVLSSLIGAPSPVAVPDVPVVTPDTSIGWPE